MHLFRFTSGDERYDETRTLEAGDRPVAVSSPFGRLALSVCYDVRYPELYRALAPFDAMFVPSAFTVPTGAAHWETLLRARAIENQAYVVAPAQGRTHPGRRRCPPMPTGECIDTRTRKKHAARALRPRGGKARAGVRHARRAPRRLRRSLLPVRPLRGLEPRRRHRQVRQLQHRAGRRRAR